MTYKSFRAGLRAVALGSACAILASACSGGGGSIVPSQAPLSPSNDPISTNPTASNPTTTNPTTTNPTTSNPAPGNPTAIGPGSAPVTGTGVSIASPPGLQTVSVTSRRLDAASVAPIASGGTLVFSDTFEADAVGRPPSGWSPASGTWSVCQQGSSSHEACVPSLYGGEALAGNSAWSNYYVDAIAVHPNFSQGGVAILGRVQDATHFYQLELRQDYAGSAQPMWYIWKYDGRSWLEIAGGAFTTQSNPYYRLRLAFSGNVISAFVAYNYTSSFQALGSGTDDAYSSGKIGLRSWATSSARFDEVNVSINAAKPPGPVPAPTKPPAPPPAPLPPPVGSANVQTIAGCPIYTPGDYYNADVTNARVDPNSASYIASVVGAGDTGGFFASTHFQRLNVAGGSTPMVAVHQKVSYHQFPTPFPFVPGYYFENNGVGDSDLLVLKVTPPNCHGYEAYNASWSNGLLWAYSGRDDDFSKPMQILPDHTPGSSASGTPHIAGMVKYEEVAAGRINHVLNISAYAHSLCNCYVKPASDTDGLAYQGASSNYRLPYGAHIRLKPSFDDSRFGPQSKAIAEALKHYGAFVTDTGNGNNAIPTIDPIGGGSWNQGDLGALGNIHFSDFDVLTVGSVKTL